MTTLSVPDMTCGHCKATVERTIQSVAPGAPVNVDLASHSVTVQVPDLAPVLAALEAQGYPAQVAG
jgi:copper chaperone